jgi:ribosome maturation factor RimP
VLDDSTVLGNSAYVLEVTSPGVDRPLTLPRHWVRAIGRLVQVTPRAGDAIVGRVLGADDSQALLDVDGTQTTVAYADLARAVVQVEFTRIDEVELDDEDLSDAEDSDDADEDLREGTTPGTGATTDPEEG